MQNDSLNQTKDDTDAASLACEPSVHTKKPFESPRLSSLGDVRTLTMGASPGTGDSGDPFNFKA